MAKVIAIFNQKGGIGKTTTATAIATGLHLRGYNTLMIDTDPQCSATDTYRAKVIDTATLYDVLCEGDPAHEAIQMTSVGAIIPCDNLLKQAESRIIGTGKEYRLKKSAESLLPDFDYIIVDTPPGVGVMLANALTFAQYAIIPITADRYGLHGLSQAKETIDEIREYTNSNLDLLGLLLVMHDKRAILSKEVSTNLPEIAKSMNTIVFNTSIRECVSTKKAQNEQESLFVYDPDSTTAEDYKSLLNELAERGI